MVDGPISTTTALKITGFKELQKILNSLPDEVQTKIERKGIRESLQGIKSDAEARAPVDTSGGSIAKGKNSKPLADSFKISVRRARKQGNLYGVLTNSAPHAHLIEYGWIYTTHAGKQLQRINGSPFLLPALEQNAEDAISKIYNSIMDSIKKYQNKISGGA